MVGAISTNSLISGLYGAGMIRPLRPGTPIGRTGRPGTGTANRAGPVCADADVLEICPAARQAARALDLSRADDARAERDRCGAPAKAGPDSLELSAAFDSELTPEQEARVRELKQRDGEVRAHEEAHRRAAGTYAQGAPKYDYEAGPDGRRYAVDGQVQIDTAPIPGDPDATIRKMQQVRRAALAPSQPSSQDRAVAAQALAAEQQARAELARQRSQERAELTGGRPGHAVGRAASGSSGAPGMLAPAQGPKLGGAPVADHRAQPAGPDPFAERFASFAPTGLFLDVAA